jgi:hypothetical protein
MKNLFSNWRIFRLYLFAYIARKVFKIPQGDVLPKYLIFLRNALMPIETYILSNHMFSVSEYKSSIILFGKEYSLESIYAMSSKKKGDRWLLFVDNDDGITKVGKVYDN